MIKLDISKAIIRLRKEHGLDQKIWLNDQNCRCVILLILKMVKPLALNMRLRSRQCLGCRLMRFGINKQKTCPLFYLLEWACFFFFNFNMD